MKWLWWSSSSSHSRNKKRRTRFEDQPFLDVDQISNQQLSLCGWGPSHGLPSLDYDTLFALHAWPLLGLPQVEVMPTNDPHTSPDGHLPFLLYEQGHTVVRDDLTEHLGALLKKGPLEEAWLPECQALLRAYLVRWQLGGYAWPTLMRRYYAQRYGPGILGWWTARCQARSLQSSLFDDPSEEEVIELLRLLHARLAPFVGGQEPSLADAALLAFIELVDAIMPASEPLKQALLATDHGWQSYRQLLHKI